MCSGVSLSNLHSPDDLGSIVSFHMPACHLYISLWEVSVQMSNAFYLSVLIFLQLRFFFGGGKILFLFFFNLNLFSFKSSLYALDNSSLSDVSFVNISFTSVA